MTSLIPLPIPRAARLTQEPSVRKSLRTWRYTPSPKRKTQSGLEESIAQRIDALLGTGDKDNKKGKPARPDLSGQLVPQLIGKELVAKMRVQQDDAFTGNRVATVTYPGDIAA